MSFDIIDSLVYGENARKCTHCGRRYPEADVPELNDNEQCCDDCPGLVDPQQESA